MLLAKVYSILSVSQAMFNAFSKLNLFTAFPKVIKFPFIVHLFCTNLLCQWLINIYLYTSYTLHTYLILTLTMWNRSCWLHFMWNWGPHLEILIWTQVCFTKVMPNHCHTKSCDIICSSPLFCVPSTGISPECIYCFEFEDTMFLYGEKHGQIN